MIAALGTDRGAVEDLFAQPGEVGRRSGYRRPCVVVRHGLEASASSIGEDDVPELASAGRYRAAVGIGGELGGEQGRIERRAPEWPVFDPPVPAEALEDPQQTPRRADAAGGRRRGEAHRMRDLRRAQLRHRPHEIRQAALPGSEERAEELLGPVGRSPDERFPDRRRRWPAGQLDHAVAHAHAGRRRGKGCGRPHRQRLDEGGPTLQPVPRLVVEREQSLVEQRRVARPEDAGGERLLGGVAVEDHVDPQAGRQRQRNGVSRGAAARRSGVQMRQQVRERTLAGGIAATERLELSPDGVRQEVCAVGNARNAERVHRGLNTARQRDLVECTGRRHVRVGLPCFRGRGQNPARSNRDDQPEQPWGAGHVLPCLGEVLLRGYSLLVRKKNKWI
jgi:hypothetical protein